MSRRGVNRNRIVALEAFVRAWDEYIGLSVHVNSMNPADEEYEQVKARLKTKHDAVSRARQVVGRLENP